MATRDAQGYDIIVVGAGPVGLAAAWHAARRGRSVLVLEQFELFTQHGSSGGDERQWRLQYSQEDLARLTLEALSLWQELERAGNRRLVHPTGSLWFGDTAEATNEGQISAALEVLDRVGIGYDRLTARDIENRFPFTGLPATYEGFYQPDGGMNDVRATLWMLFEQARSAGAKIREHERVTELDPDGDGVTVRTSRGVFRADQVIVAAGAFADGLLDPLGIKLELHRFAMTSVSFRLRDATADLPTWFAFQPATAADTNLFYGFGRNPWSASDLVRAAPDFEDNVVKDPYEADHTAHPRHVSRVVEWVTAHLPVLDPEPHQPRSHLAVLPADPNRQFYFGRPPSGVPHGERLVVFSAGWGFKFVPLLGRACADLAIHGSTSYDLSRFSLS